jgi:uncharacterized protein
MLARSHRAQHTAEPDPEQARQLYERALSLGDRISALSGLGYMHLNNELPDANPATALALFEDAATRGDPRAQTTLAAIYLAAAGVPDMMTAEQTAAIQGLLDASPAQLFAQAAELCVEAAASGHVPAKVQCAFVFAQGPDAIADAALSQQYLLEAAQAGDLNSQLNLADRALARIAEGDEGAAHEAVRWYRAAARQGHLRAKNNLAWFLATSNDEDLRRPQEALAAARAAVAGQPTPDYLDTLAAAYAASGDFEQAQEVQRAALEALSEDSEIAGDYRERLNHYEQGRPWRE